MQENSVMKISTSILAGAAVIALAVFFRPDLESEGGLNGGAAAINSKQVIIIEYSDFQCPYCKMFWQNAYQQLKKEYVDTGKVVFEYRHYPLPNHAEAQKAAEASECARDQGQFWQYHDVLFARGEGDGTGLAVEDLKSYAVELNLDTDAFNACLDGGEKEEKVKSDALAGQRAGVGGTPTFLINGEVLVGAQPIETFRDTIDKQLE